MNLTVDRTFFMDFFTDDTIFKLRFKRFFGEDRTILPHLFPLLDKWAARIGEILGVGNTFKWPGVNERRLRSDVVYGDKYVFGEALCTIGDNGNNGEFGV